MHNWGNSGLTHAIISPIHLHVVWRTYTGIVANSVVTCPWATNSRSLTFIHIYSPKKECSVNTKPSHCDSLVPTNINVVHGENMHKALLMQTIGVLSISVHCTNAWYFGRNVLERNSHLLAQFPNKCVYNILKDDRDMEMWRDYHYHKHPSQTWVSTSHVHRVYGRI